MGAAIEAIWKAYPARRVGLASQAEWYADAMRTTIDAAGRLVVPKSLRDELGFSGGTELELQAVDGRLQVAVPSRARVEQGPYGVRFAGADAASLDADLVRQLLERSRR